MAQLQASNPIVLSAAEMLNRTHGWVAQTKRLPKSSGEAVGKYCDSELASSLALMLGGIPVCRPLNRDALGPRQPNCVELGPCRVVGAIRPQNFDLIYRPDGVRIVHDNKTLNNVSSVAKNYQNMINDLSTEASTVHIRFPYAVVSFVVMVPEPCLVAPHRRNLIGALERMSGRSSTTAGAHLVEALALVVWDPVSGAIDPACPPPASTLRIESLANQIETAYAGRYKSLPPHDV